MVAEGILVPAGTHTMFLTHKLYRVAAVAGSGMSDQAGAPPAELDDHMQFEQRHLARMKALESTLEAANSCQ